MKTKIIDTAEALFHEYDFDTVSVKDIAARVGVTTGALYHHFRSKEDILEEIGRRHTTQFEKLCQEYEHSTAPLQDLRTLLTGIMVRRVQEDGMVFTRYRVQKIMRFNRDAGLPRCVRILVRKGVELGELRAEIPQEDQIDLLLSVYRGAVYQYSISEAPLDLEKTVARRLELTLGGLLREPRG